MMIPPYLGIGKGGADGHEQDYTEYLSYRCVLGYSSLALTTPPGEAETE